MFLSNILPQFHRSFSSHELLNLIAWKKVLHETEAWPVPPEISRMENFADIANG